VAIINRKEKGCGCTQEREKFGGREGEEGGGRCAQYDGKYVFITFSNTCGEAAAEGVEGEKV
jgi:hypothetical protein